jgi:hypothetical protein
MVTPGYHLVKRARYHSKPVEQGVSTPKSKTNLLRELYNNPDNLKFVVLNRFVGLTMVGQL